MTTNGLDPRQQAAVTHGTGPLLVLAGAGSGKTRVLTHRTAHLIGTGQARAHEVLLLTFTRKAAKEMTARLAGLVSEDSASAITAGTFHSLALRLLRERDPSLEVWDDLMTRRTIRGLLGSPSRMFPDAISWGDDNDLGLVMHALTILRSERAGPDADFAAHLPDYDPEFYDRLRDLWTAYEKRKAAAGGLDFDDMLCRLADLLESDADFRREQQSRFRWVLVDETQDSNQVQNDILRSIAAPENNVTAVGDVRQAIYSWRGSRPELVFEFAKVFPGAKVVSLVANYRSRAPIVRAANGIARSMPESHDDLEPSRGEGTEPTASRHDDADEEALFVASDIAARVAQGARAGEHAIIYRTNAQSRALEDALVEAGVPYVVLGGLGFYGRSEVRDMLAYLQCALDPEDDEAVARVISRPTRYLGRAYIDQVREWVARSEHYDFQSGLTTAPGLKRWQVQRAQEFRRLVDRIAKLDPARAIAFVRNEGGYDAWLRGDEGDEEQADNSRIENLDELVIAATRFTDSAEFLAFARQQQEAAKASEGTLDRVQIMTIHRAKGLEWPYVYVVGVSLGLLPHKRALSDREHAEERRAWYVAFTRAQEHLHASCIEEWQGRPLIPSPFLDEAGLTAEAVDAHEVAS